MLPPDFLHKLAPNPTTSSFIQKPTGQAVTKCIPHKPAAKHKEWATLFSPSPIKASFKPLSSLFISQIVNKSANTWHGCSQSESPLITGTREFAASSQIVLWAKALAISPSPIRETTLATSLTDSRTPKPMSVGAKYTP